MEHEFNCLRLPPLDTDMINDDKKKTTMSIAYFNSTILEFWWYWFIIPK